jgi:serine/threonine-protein kinase RsbW
VARERPTASTDQPEHVQPIRPAPPKRPPGEGLTRAEARALTRCAPLTPAGEPAHRTIGSTVWVERADRLGVGDLRRRVAAFAALAGMRDGALAEMQVAVSEALTNVVVHAYRDAGEVGDVRVDAEVDADDLVISVRDYGLGMGPRPDSPGLGLGLAIIARLSKSSMTRRCEDGGTEVRMTFELGNGKPARPE